jgi:hypothetical protein
LLHELCSTNSTMKQLHKKPEFVEYLSRCSHNSTIFLKLSAWTWNCLTKKHKAELKKFGAEQSQTPAIYIYICTRATTSRNRWVAIFVYSFFSLSYDNFCHIWHLQE